MIKKITLLAVVLIIIASPFFAFAQTQTTNPTVNPCKLSSVQGSPDRIGSLPKCVNQIYVWSLGVGVLLALLMMVLGGYYLMTAAGNAEQAAKGKEYITGALIGVTILFAAYLLLNEINPDLVNFNLDSIKRLDGTQDTSNIRQ